MTTRVIKSRRIIVLFSLAVSALLLSHDTAQAFEDAGVHQPAVDALNEHVDGMFDGTGCSDGTGLCSQEPLRRWEMAVWLVRVLDGVEPEEPPTSRFADVDVTEWWMAHVDRLAELAVTHGCATDPLRFCPDKPVTRAQMASFLVRAFQLEDAGTAGFQDVRQSVHVNSIDALAAAGITAGCSIDPPRYCPNANVKRGQMASFLARALGLVSVAPTSNQYSSVSAGWRHSCGLGTGGRVHCWGLNDVGQADAPGGTFVQVSAGGFHSCGLTNGGRVHCWGLNDDGQADAPGGTFVQVSAGGFHSCGLTNGGRVHCWGLNDDGQADAPGGTFVQVSAGGFHSCGLTNGGRVHCWGYNDAGQATGPDAALRSLSSGRLHSCGVRTDGRVECWGSNRAGQAAAPDGTFSEVASGVFHSCGLRTDGQVHCWGADTAGQTSAPSEAYSSVSAGGFHSCGVRTDGRLECWGGNEAGQIDVLASS